MRHVKKKFLKQTQLSDKVANIFNSVEVDHNALGRLQKANYEGYYAMSITSTNEMIQMFRYATKNKSIFIPEPNPIVIYFHTAQSFIKNLKPAKAELLLTLDTNSADLGKAINKAYNYFSQASICATFLFNAVEAFINLLIPEGFIYTITKAKNSEVYTKEQLQRWVSFQEKIKSVVPEATSKAFHLEYAAKFDRIVKLNALRDEIVHTKTDLASKPNWYEKLYTLLLDFDFDNTALAVRDFINYYQSDLIEECDCGKDY